MPVEQQRSGAAPVGPADRPQHRHRKWDERRLGALADDGEQLVAGLGPQVGEVDVVAPLTRSPIMRTSRPARVSLDRPALRSVSMSEDASESRPIGEVLGSAFQVPPLLKGWTALDGIVLVKCLNENGRSAWAFRETEGLNEEEVIGALTVQLDLMRERVRAQYYDDDE